MNNPWELRGFAHFVGDYGFLFQPGDKGSPPEFSLRLSPGIETMVVFIWKGMLWQNVQSKWR